MRNQPEDLPPKPKGFLRRMLWWYDGLFNVADGHIWGRLIQGRTGLVQWKRIPMGFAALGVGGWIVGLWIRDPEAFFDQEVPQQIIVSPTIALITGILAVVIGLALVAVGVRAVRNGRGSERI